MLVSFDIKFIRLDQKQPTNGDIKRHLHGFLFIMHHHWILRHEKHQTNENQTQFCSKLLTLQVCSEINW